MAKITDPDSLNDKAVDDGTTEVFINTATKRIKLNVTGNLSTDGVTLKALYSFLKEEWIADPFSKNLAAYDFPIVSITSESFELVDGWDFENDAARYLIRDGGWTVKNIAGATTQKWAGIIGLGSVGASDQIYFQQSSSGSSTDFQLLGQVNQAIQILRDDDGDGIFAEGSDFDRTSFLKLFVRVQGKTYDSVSLSDIGVTSMDSIAYRLPIGNATDTKITHSDVQIDANSDNTADVSPYSGMSITFYAVAQSRTIGGVARNFGIIINGNNGTAEQIYEFVQWSLRRTTDIDAGAGSAIGKITDEMLVFVGDTLKTQSVTNPAGGGSGVYIDNFQSGDTNRLVFVDNLAVERTYPFVALLTINFGANLQADPDAKFWVYFETLPGAGNDFGESGATIVNDNAGSPMTGLVSGASQLQLTFNYDGNTQGGRTAGTDAAIVVVGIGKTVSQHVKQSGSIQRSVSNSVSLVSALERNYST